MIFWKEDSPTVLTRPPFLLFDIGGTKIRMAVSIDGKNLENPVVVGTPKDFNQGMQVFAETARKIIGQNSINFVAGGMAGSLDSTKAVVFKSPHLPDWSGKNIKKAIGEAVRAPVLVENDAAMVGLGEAMFGSGKGFRIVVYITLSTGVNGSRVIDGKLDRSSYGFEIGHQIINFDAGVTGGDWGRGELEDYVSGAAISQRFGKLPEEIEDESVWENATKALAYGIHNVIVYWSPEVIVLGGGVSKRISLERLTAYLDEILKIFPSVPILKKAALGEMGGLYGSLFYIQNFGVS